MQSVGIRLKEARVKKGYSLDEIGARTRISSRNLNAIEFDHVLDISSPFFYRSFVRQYAGEVGVDYHLLAPAVETLAATMRQPDLPGQGEHQPVRIAPLQFRIKRDLSWVVPAAMFVGAVILGSGGFAAWKFYKPLPLIQKSVVSMLLPQTATAQPTPSSSVPKPVKPPIEVAAVSTASNAVASTSPAETSVQAAEQKAAATDKIHLELAATERTWLSLSADGKPAYTGILEAAETKVVEGQESAKVRTGNAGGVHIIFNGKSIGAIGPRGKTRTVVFTRTGYEVQPSYGERPTPANHIGG